MKQVLALQEKQQLVEEMKIANITYYLLDY
jgi:uncharacterized membrane-anchored protein